MISKLVAWAEDRPLAIARMRRALAEYLVTGIKTTLPFFTWLLAEPAFVEGRFHTTYLDEVLTSRNGRPFVEPTADVEEMAAIAAALQAVLSPAARLRRERPAGESPARPPLASARRASEGCAECGTRSRSADGSGTSWSRAAGGAFCSDRRRPHPGRRRRAHRRAHAVAHRGQCVDRRTHSGASRSPSRPSRPAAHVHRRHRLDRRSVRR